jgi:lipopolysaccharide heptosyltransferase II
MSWKNVRNLLCVRLDGIGDVLMTTPALRAFKESLPDCRVTLLTSPAGATVAPLVPEIDETLQFSAPWMKAAGSRRSDDARMVRTLMKRRFDAAAIFTVYTQNPLPAAYLCYLAGIPLRLAHCHENPYQLLTDWQPDPEPVNPIRHEVQRQLDLAAVVGCTTANQKLSFRVPDAARARVRELLRPLIPERPLVAVHPGASAASRRYPPESYARAVDLLAGCQIVFTGDALEYELVERIRAAVGVPTRSLAGELSLAELGALLGEADLLVSNNTGPAHIAAALGTPVVDLYALTNPQHTPWQVENRVLFQDVPCRNCYKSVCPAGHHECLRGVSPERVAAAARDLLRLQ